MIRVCEDCERTERGEPVQTCDHNPLINYPIHIGAIALPEGSHWIDISGKNIDTRTFRVTLPNDHNDAEINLYGIPITAGFLTVNINVSGAALRINDGLLEPPGEFFLPFDTHTLAVSHDGYEDYKISFVFNDSTLDTLTIELVPSRSSSPFYTQQLPFIRMVIAVFVVVLCIALLALALHYNNAKVKSEVIAYKKYCDCGQCKYSTCNHSINAEKLQSKIRIGKGKAKRPLLPEMNFVINKGDFIFITGASGSGKTVLLRMLAGYNRKYSGALKYEGEKTRQLSSRLLPLKLKRYKRLNNVGYVPQYDALYRNSTPRKLLRDYYQLEIGSKVGMDEYIENICLRLKININEILDRKIKDLSGGELKRVSIAIELLRAPDILLLDEPDSGLDPVSRHELYRLLRDINKQHGTTIIFTTHQSDRTLFEVQYSDNISDHNGRDGGVMYYEYKSKTIFHEPGSDNQLVYMHTEIGAYAMVQDTSGNWIKSNVDVYDMTFPPRVSKETKYPPLLKRLSVLTKREFRLYRENWKWVVAVTLLCMFALNFATDIISFTNYDDALATAFATVCAAILIGLMMSINLVGKDYSMIRRELHMGVPAIGLTLSKMLVVFVGSIVMSLIVAAPYLTNRYDIYGINKPWFYVSVFVTMCVSAGLGLLVSTITRNKLQVAALSVPIIVLYQILFSGFIFERISDNFRRFSISLYSIRAVGSTLNFTTDAFTLPYGDFVNSNAHHTGNLLRLIIGFVVILTACVLFMWRIWLNNDNE